MGRAYNACYTASLALLFLINRWQHGLRLQCMLYRITRSSLSDQQMGRAYNVCCTALLALLFLINRWQHWLRLQGMLCRSTSPFFEQQKERGGRERVEQREEEKKRILQRCTESPSIPGRCCFRVFSWLFDGDGTVRGPT